MKPSHRAALMNAFLFPGVGHLSLKRVGRGLLFLAPTLVAALVFMNGAMDVAQEVAAQVMNGTVSLDPTVLAARIERSSASAPWMNASVYVIIACWAGSIIDALFLLGRDR